MTEAQNNYLNHFFTCPLCGAYSVCADGSILLQLAADETARRIAPEPKGGEA